MIRTLRALFLRCQLREKLLLLAFALMGVVLWLSGYSSRAGKFWAEKRATTKTLGYQAQLIDQSPAIEAAAQKAAAQLDPTKTLNENRLATTVQQLASEAGLRDGRSTPPATTTSGNISIHTLDYSVSRANWDPLIKFYQAIQARSPYIGIVKFSLNATGGQHNLSLTVSSIEVAH